jgi:hypothetical protein
MKGSSYCSAATDTHSMLTIQTPTIPPLPVGALRRPLLTPLDEPGHFLLVLDNSSAEKFTTCPTAARNYLVLEREGAARSAALTFGGAVHAGLEKLLLGADSSAQDAAIANYFTNHPCDLDSYRTVNNALAVIDSFRRRVQMPDYSWTILSDDAGPLIERAFELPLGVLKVDGVIDMPWTTFEYSSLVNSVEEEEQQKWYNALDIRARLSKALQNGMKSPRYVSHVHVAWSGRTDLIANWNGENRVVDHKTASDKRYANPEEYFLSNATIGYVWAAQQLWPDLNVTGAAINFLVFKKPTGTGPIDQPGPRGGEPSLSIFPAFFHYTPERLSWWKHNTMTIVSDFIHCLVRNDFPMHTKWCFGKYGTCPYHPVCCEDNADIRESLLQSAMYRNVTWNPVR